MARTLSYVNYSVEELVVQLQDRLKATGTWHDIYRSSTGQMLIELFSYVTNVGMYYTERRAEESYITTAKLRSSVVNLVSLLNYQPKRKTSSIGSLTFSIALALSKIVYIPKNTECQTASGVKFLTSESVAIEKGQTSISATAVQGELLEIEVVSNGSTSQEYIVNDISVEDSASTSNPTLRIIVDGVVWEKVDSFLYSENVDKDYRVINEMDSTISIQFGDNVSGLAPSVGSTIVIQYVKSDGLDGNVANADQITTINSDIYDEDGSSVTVTVTNSGSFLGGDDEEDIEEIRYEAPRVFKTGDRAVSKTDFISILENYSGVANANVWGENEEAELEGVAADYEMLNKVKMCIVLQEWELPDAAFKTILSTYIYDKSMLTVKYEFADPTFLLIIPVLAVKVTEGYSLSQTQAEMETVLEAQFDLGSTTRLGTITKYSNIISALDDLDGVAYTNMTLEIKKVLSDTYDSACDYGAALDATDIKPGSARLFVDGTYVTVDADNGDGTGAFSDAGVYTISGSINYSTGEVLLDISPAPTTSIWIRYQQDEDGNVVPSFRQISKLDSVDVQSIQMES